MLYDFWRQVVSEKKQERAVLDLTSKRWWTFQELSAQVERLPSTQEKIVCPIGNNLEFVLELLRAWRDGLVVCPCETQPATDLISFPVPSSIVHLKTTSATTGPKKFVGFTAEQLRTDCENIVSTMGLRPDWPNIGAISLSHSYGFSNLILPLVLKGIPLVLVPFPFPETLREALKTVYSPTLPAVPALWKNWLETRVFECGQISLAISAGAPLPLDLEAACYQQGGIKIHNFYGATECGGIAYDRTLAPRKDPTLIGTALDGVFLETDANGFLIVKGASVGSGYLPISNDRLVEGIYKTSDMVQLENGQVFLLGRGDDLINYAGRKIAPEIIENALNSHPSVKDCIVFSTPAEDSNHRIISCVVLRPTERMTSRQLQTFLLERLEIWQIPKEFYFLDELPTNERGKRSRADWREKYKRKETPFYAVPDKVS
jgi:long-chain acyl-CoA synthetase